MSFRSHSFTESKGFSLIELLTVIAVVAILAAILVPTISAVRQRAYLTECQGNMRYIGISLQHYLAEHDQIMPGPLTGAQPARYRIDLTNTLAAYLSPYMELPDPDGDFQDNPYFMCPAHEALLNGDEADPRSYGIPVTDTPYPYGYSSSNPENPNGPKNLYWLMEPNNYPTVKDYLWKGGRGWVLRDTDQNSGVGPSNSRTAFDPVHGNVRNFLFLDGSVEAIPLEDTP